MKRVKTPTIIQMEAVECGAASLAIILGYYGHYVPLEEVRLKCGVTRDGSNALNLVRAARSYGLEASGVKIEREELQHELFPLIVFWGFNHFVVIEGFGKKKVYINDPASGPRVLSYEEFDENYTGVALLFKPTEAFEKRKVPKKMWTLLNERLGEVKGPVLFLILCGFGLLFPGLFMPGINQVFFDNVLGEKYWNWVPLIVFAIVLLAGITFLFTWLQTRYLNRLFLRLSSLFSMEFLWRLLHLPLQFYAQRFKGEIAYRMRLNANVAGALTGTFAMTVVSICLVIFYILVMYSYDPVIASIGVLAALLNLAVLWWITRSRQDAYIRMQQEMGKGIGFSIGALQNIETIKAAGNEDDFFTRWVGYNAKKLNAQREIYTKDVILTSVPPFLQGMAICALLGVGAWRILHGDLTVGMLMALQALMTAFLLPVNQLVGYSNLLQTMKIDVDRLNDALKSPVDLVYVPEEGQESRHQKKLEGHLELRNVTFGYSPLDPPLIENFSFVLKPGERIAFVGPTGSGKSTLAKLISGLYQPWSGEILYDGLPLTKISRSVFATSIGLVDQLIVLFEGTIKENLTLWDATISDEQILEAAKDACIHDEIMARNGGYEAQVLENGRNFSGGQQQRFEIAKALVLSPRILIMDEATSSLDSMTEILISQNVRRRGCTCAMIAHRLSTIRDCDEIIVLDRGKIVQRGSHDSLKNVKGVYQTLVGMEQL